MHVIASERAAGRTWKDAAASVGLSENTVTQYPSRYSGWGALVEYYRQKLIDDRFEDHWTNGTAEAFDALRNEFRSSAQKLREMEQRAMDGELSPEVAAKALSLSRAVVQAASAFLDATGRKKYNHTVAELKAQKEVNGEPGQRINLKTELANLEDKNAAELARLYRDIAGP